MNLRLPLVFALTFVATAAAARTQSGTITYKPNKVATEGRPVVVKASVAPRGEDFVFKLEYDKVAYGEGCKALCARSMLLLDTDGDESTGLQQGRGKPNTGADLALSIEGLESFEGGKVTPYLKATVRQFKDEDRTLEDGDLVGTYDHRKDARIKLDGKKVTVEVDASAESLPQGKTCRLIYLAPGVRPLVAKCVGRGGNVPREAVSESGSSRRSGGGVVIERGRPASGAEARARARRQAKEEGGVTRQSDIVIDNGGSAYDRNRVLPGGEGG